MFPKLWNTVGGFAVKRRHDCVCLTFALAVLSSSEEHVGALGGDTDAGGGRGEEWTHLGGHGRGGTEVRRKGSAKYPRSPHSVKTAAWRERSRCRWGGP